MKPYAALVLSLGVAVAPSMLQAQDAWPARPITFLVPYGAGGYTDLVARLTGRYVEKALGRPVIVDTRPGAGGIVGTQAVVNAAADGYMFCVCSIGAISIAPFDPNQKVGYDPVRDLAPVGLVSSIAQAVVVKKDLPVTTMAELVSYAKANPGKLNYGSSGAGGLTHYSVELFQARTGIKVVHIPFKGGAQSTAAVVAGEVDFSFANMTDGLPQVQGGSVRGLAVTSHKRSPYLPDLPTVHEAILPDFFVETWNGIMAPSEDSGTDRPQAVGNLDQDGRRSGSEGDDAQGGRRHRQDHAGGVPCADRAGNCAMEAADRGNRTEEVIGAAFGSKRILHQR